MIIDTERNEVIFDDQSRVSLYTPEGFKALSDIWLRVGWDQKYLYSFTWMGRPIIQLPDDMFRMQELIYEVKPNLLIETGIAHGGSLIFYAQLLNLFDNSRVIGVDIDIRQHNRLAIENHELFPIIELVEGDSTYETTISKLTDAVASSERVLVVLDSAHDYDHVYRELQIYSQFVSSRSYIVVTDGSQEYLGTTPRSKRDYPGYVDTWSTNNPKRAAEDFCHDNPDFEIVEPDFPFNEGSINFRVTLWPSAFIRKRI